MVCLARGGVGGEGDEWIGFGVFQASPKRGSVVRVSMFGVRWCRWGVGRGFGPGFGGGGVLSCYVCVSCESAIYILCLVDTCTS